MSPPTGESLQSLLDRENCDQLLASEMERHVTMTPPALSGRTCHALTALASLALSGCVSLRMENFELEVPASEIKTIGRAIASAEDIRRDSATMAEKSETSQPSDADIDRQAIKPLRVDDSAETPGSVIIDKVVIRSTAARLPHRAPNLSSAQTASMICSALLYRFPDGRARRAHEATLEAARLREAFDRGDGDGREADRAELARQDAVRDAMSVPIPILDNVFNLITRKSDLPGPRSGPLMINDLGLLKTLENGREVLIIAGTVRNNGDQEEDVPPITMIALDEWDFVLSGQSALIPVATLAPNEEASFRLRFLNPPETAYEIAAHFAPPFRYYGDNRSCDYIDPSLSDRLTGLESAVSDEPVRDLVAGVLAPYEAEFRAAARTSLNERVADLTDPYRLATFAGSADVPYSVGELNAMTRHFRGQAAREWRCRKSEAPDCIGSSRRLGWRDSFAMAETANEAWMAMVARSAVEQTDSGPLSSHTKLEDARRAEERALTALRQIGEASLTRAGRSQEGIRLNNVKSALTQERGGLFLEIEGEVSNERTAPSKVQDMLVALVDRYGVPLASVLVPVNLDLATAETRSFTLRTPATRATGPIPQKQSEDPGLPYLGRLPPEMLPWEVRIAIPDPADDKTRGAS